MLFNRNLSFLKIPFHSKDFTEQKPFYAANSIFDNNEMREKVENISYDLEVEERKRLSQERKKIACV